MRKWVTTAGLLFAATQSHAQFVNSSLEQYNYQIGDATLELRSYDSRILSMVFCSRSCR